MRIKKLVAEYLFLFWFGGSVYIEAELLYRQYTHWSMFVLAGFVFVTVGLMNEYLFSWQDSVLWQIGVATLWATACEYVCGVILLKHGLVVWDYSDLPLNIDGFICVPFMCVWAVFMIVAIVTDDIIKYCFFNGDRPHYHICNYCIMLLPWNRKKIKRG